MANSVGKPLQKLIHASSDWFQIVLTHCYSIRNIKILTVKDFLFTKDHQKLDCQWLMVSELAEDKLQ